MRKLAVILVVLVIGSGVFLVSRGAEIEYRALEDSKDSSSEAKDLSEESARRMEEPATHMDTPKEVRAIYMTSWVAGTRDWRASLIKMIEESDLNAIVIDIKDDTGRISFNTDDQELSEVGASENRIDDLDEFLEELHEKGIYVIGRVSVFQDPYLVSKRPDLAVRRASDGGVWQDRKGLTWLDAGSKDVWDYIARIARESHSRGFDEINFDYIRFPSDGNIHDTLYPESEDKVRSEVIEDFFAYLSDELGDEMTISADLFGLVTIAEDDLGIGQEIMRALPYFDYIAPMIYPSHFASGTFGYGNPAEHPFEIVKESMATAIERTTATSTIEHRTVGPSAQAGTTTEAVVVPREHFPKEKLRPWIQDFDLGADYGKAEVEAQIKALNDFGLKSYMIWDPSNKYSRGVSY